MSFPFLPHAGVLTGLPVLVGWSQTWPVIVPDLGHDDSSGWAPEPFSGNLYERLKRSPLVLYERLKSLWDHMLRIMKLSMALCNFHPSQGENSCMVGKKCGNTQREVQSRVRVLTHFWEPVSLAVKNLLPMQETKETWFDPWVGKIRWSRKWPPAPVFLPGKFHGQRSLAGPSPQGRRVGCDRAQNTHSILLDRKIHKWGNVSVHYLSSVFHNVLNSIYTSHWSS